MCRRSSSPSRRARLIVLAAALSGAHSVAAQAPSPATQPTFRSGIQLVEVDVRVFDSAGRFVTGLTRDDFELVENGEPQNISVLHVVGANPVAVSASAASPPAIPLQASAGTAATPAAAPQTWIFFFDLAHLTPGGGFDRARAAVEGFIRDRLPNGNVAGILAGDQMINNRLTSVKQELLNAVKQVKPRGDARARAMELTREWPRLLDEDEAIRIARGEPEAIRRATSRACADDPDFCTGGDPEPNVREKGQRTQQDAHRATAQTLAAMNGLAGGLAKVPGPKTLVLLSEGFVTQDVETTLRSVVGQTTRAGTRVYAIDVRGLNRAANPGIIDQAYAEDAFGAASKFDGLADGPNSLAIDTGGLMIRNENNIGRALDRIADDAGRYYVLAYQPSNTNVDGGYRSLQVRVKRDAVRVRARRGYLALPASRMLLPQPIAPRGDEDALVAAAAAPEPPRTDGPEALPAVPSSSPATRPAASGSPHAGAAAGIRLRPDAEGRVNALSARETGDTGALATAGWDAYQRGDVEAALASFERAAAEPGVRPWVLYALGMSQAALGRAEGAIRSWQRVRQAAPDFQPVYMDLADGYAALADLTSALAIVRQAEARWPDSAGVHSAIGVILVRRGALDDGIEALAKAVGLNPGDDLAYLNLARAYALRYQRGRRYVTSQRRWVAPEGDRLRAIDALERCVKLDGPYVTQAREELMFLGWSGRG